MPPAGGLCKHSGLLDEQCHGIVPEHCKEGIWAGQCGSKPYILFLLREIIIDEACSSSHGVTDARIASPSRVIPLQPSQTYSREAQLCKFTSLALRFQINIRSQLPKVMDREAGLAVLQSSPSLSA
jgi:hypothetical protein